MEKQQMPAGEAQNSQKKEWYKSGWGLVIAILLLPYFLLWYMWAKTSWSKGVKIAITIVFAFINIVALAGDESTQEKTATAPEKQQVEIAKVEETASTQKQAEESKPAGLTDEEKAKLKTFYDEILAESKVADDAYENWTTKLESNTPTQAYMDAEELKKVIRSQKQQIVSLKIPDVNIEKDDKNELTNAISDISTMYFTKIEAIELMQDYLNTQDMEKITKAKEKFELSNSFLFSGIGKITGIFVKYDVELPSN